MSFKNIVKPLICAPVIAVSKEEIKHQIKQIKTKPIDVIEWRTDFFTGDIIDFLPEVIEACGDKELLLTYRTKAEGGNGESTKYSELLEKACTIKGLSAIDIELSMGDKKVESYIKKAKANAITSVVSAHFFHNTPSEKELADIYAKMSILGADIPKIATMPKELNDVLIMIKATNDASLKYKNVIGISMSKLGAMTRLCPKEIGSCLSFVSGVGASAPGQLSAELVSAVIGELE